ncbi:MAG: M48 family metallopeptidase [Floccifex sp.]
MSNVKKGNPSNAKQVNYTVKISRQKGIRMRVTAHGELVVHANPFCSVEAIEKYVEAHVNEFNYQPSVRIFGRSFRIKKVKSLTNRVSYSEDELLIQYKEKSDVESLYKRFLNQISKEVFKDILDMMYFRFSNYEFEKPKIIIRTMKSSWGICHPDKNSITLNSELVHYPVDFIEYVICHEMIHFIEPNHSEAFYKILKEVMPDYKRRIDLIETSEEKQYLM